ncbi:glycosyltransferase family 2 protein [bacterium]|nr:glycosyltransferase family 2 protein [bacterium]
MKKPLVSVIIPTFNRANVIKRAVISVLNQTFTDFECIVVDDGSTDETDSVLSEFSGKIRAVKKENRGVAAARNSGAELAEGNFIAFLDSDDEWKKEKLSRQISYMNESGLRISQTDEIWVRNGKFVNKSRKYIRPSGDIFYKCLEVCAVTPSSVMMERKLFYDYGGFDESFPVCEDFDLWLRMSPKEKFGLIDEPLIIKYGGAEDQLSNAVGMDKYRIISIYNMLSKDKELDENHKRALFEALVKKVKIYAEGAKKHEKFDEAAWAESLLSGFSGF